MTVRHNLHLAQQCNRVTLKLQNCTNRAMQHRNFLPTMTSNRDKLFIHNVTLLHYGIYKYANGSARHQVTNYTVLTRHY